MDAICEWRSICSYDECFASDCLGEVLVQLRPDNYDSSESEEKDANDDDSRPQRGEVHRRAWFHLIDIPAFIVAQLEDMGIA